MYQALYRKYRPQTFSDVVGQKSVTDTLRAQLETGRLSHAYLFTGTRGTGKTSCAKILAKAVNCENPNHGDPCGVCPSCRAIDEGSCMDVLEIDAASNNGVDSVRVLRDDAIYTPGTVKMRVYIIDEVHMLSTAAFNALLKIIEEPPAHLLFILATTELQKVPATILSRCQRFAFKRLRPDEIASRLNFIAYQEHIEIEPEAINLLARLADGGMRDGVSLLDQCASAANGPVTLESVYASLGLAGEKRTAELMQAIAEQDTAKALTIFSALYSAGKDVSALLGEMCALCRDLLVLRTAPKSGLSMLSGIATEQQALALQTVFSPGELMRVLTETQKTRASFGKNTDVRVAAELLLMQLCEPSLRLDAQALDARISRVEEQLASGVMVKAAPQTSGDEYDDDRPPFPDDADDPERGQLPEMAPAQPAPAAPKPETPVSFRMKSEKQTSYRDEQHFIGAEMPVGRESESAFLGVAQDDVAKLTASVNDALFELMPDDAQAMASRRKIVRWDNKRKRYVRGTVGELRDNAHIRNESGQLIRGKSKVKRGELYEKWRQKHRVDQQAMGETGETRETSGRRRGREKKTKGEKHILREERVET